MVNYDKSDSTNHPILSRYLLTRHGLYIDHSQLDVSACHIGWFNACDSNVGLFGTVSNFDSDFWVHRRACKLPCSSWAEARWPVAAFCMAGHAIDPWIFYRNSNGHSPIFLRVLGVSCQTKIWEMELEQEGFDTAPIKGHNISNDCCAIWEQCKHPFLRAEK